MVTPLSNDPTAITEYLVNIGVKEGSFNVNEVFSFDEEMLGFIPESFAYIFLFEYSDYFSERHKDDKEPTKKCPFHMRQYVGNTCGTVALLHSIVNNQDLLSFTEGSWISNFLPNCGKLHSDELGKLVENNKEIIDMHESAARGDDTPVPSDVLLHYIAFVKFNKELWELDGQKPYPICHGPCESLVESAVAVIKKEFLPHISDQMSIGSLTLSK